MKVYMLLAVFFASYLMAVGELSDKEMKRLRDVEIAGIRTDTWKNKDREKYETLEISTFQSEDDPVDYDMPRFRMRLVIELTDKQKNTYLVTFTGKAPEDYDSEYQGEDYWTLYMAHGDLERLNVSGHAIQYGIMDGETFVPLAEEMDHYDDVMAGVKKRTTRIFPGKVYLRHYYMYDDSSNGVTQSIPTNIKAVKE